MDVRITDKHERLVFVAIPRGQLEGIIERALAEKTGIPLETLRKHGKVEIEPNMEGSPSYQSGYRASFRAAIPIEPELAPEGDRS